MPACWPGRRPRPLLVRSVGFPTLAIGAAGNCWRQVEDYPVAIIVQRLLAAVALATASGTPRVTLTGRSTRGVHVCEPGASRRVPHGKRRSTLARERAAKVRLPRTGSDPSSGPSGPHQRPRGPGRPSRRTGGPSGYQAEHRVPAYRRQVPCATCFRDLRMFQLPAGELLAPPGRPAAPEYAVSLRHLLSGFENIPKPAKQVLSPYSPSLSMIALSPSLCLRPRPLPGYRAYQ